MSVLLAVRWGTSKAGAGVIWRRSHLHIGRVTLALHWDLSQGGGWNAWPSPQAAGLPHGLGAGFPGPASWEKGNHVEPCIVFHELALKSCCVAFAAFD